VNVSQRLKRVSLNIADNDANTIVGQYSGIDDIGTMAVKKDEISNSEESHHMLMQTNAGIFSLIHAHEFF